MSKAHNAELQARVQQYMREHNMSQAEMARVSGVDKAIISQWLRGQYTCLLYTSPSPRDMRRSRMPSSA